MERSFGGITLDTSRLAVGVSGGPDSMALLWLLQDWCAKQGKDLHVLSVDHGLREEAQQRAEDIDLASFLDAKGAAWIRSIYDMQLTDLVSTYPEANFVIERAFRGEIRNKLFEDLED